MASLYKRRFVTPRYFFLISVSINHATHLAISCLGTIPYTVEIKKKVNAANPMFFTLYSNSTESKVTQSVRHNIMYKSNEKFN